MAKWLYRIALILFAMSGWLIAIAIWVMWGLTEQNRGM